MAKIKINGREIEAPPGQKLIQVCIDNGFFVPHYCWHRGLTPAGNCRMCLVKVSNSRKLEVACMYNCTDNLEVTTEGPEVDAARKAVLEYLLINHPLDCPICDKAGECDLQDYTYKYRHGLSRFEEDKVVKHTKDLGPNIKIWGARCIACTRCVRFCEEIAGTSELTLVSRGDHSVVDVHPEVPIDNPMSLNVVDICPVGALIDKNFLYKARVWFTKKVETVCAQCSHGCNVNVTVLKNDLKRVQPRHNEAVNDYWMCDDGRLTLGYVRSEQRLVLGKGTTKDVATSLRQVAQSYGKGAVAIVASTYATNEELHLVKQLADALGARVAFHTKTKGERWVSKSGFAIETDKTPNTAGARRVFGELDTDLDGLAGQIRGGQVKALLSVNGIPDYEVPEALVAAADQLELLAVGDILQNPLTAKARFVLASACWAEKDGTYTNRDGRVQRVRPAVVPPGAARPELAWLQDVLVHLGVRKGPISAEGIFREAFPGLDYGKVGSKGLVPSEVVPTQVAAPASPGVSGVA